MTAPACIGEPVSWLRLEQFALDAGDPEIAAHVRACPACAQCLEGIAGEAVELPRLVVPATPTRRWTRWWLAPAMAAVAAAVILLVVGRDPEIAPARDDIAYGVKGVGDVLLGIVRERDGTIRHDVLTYRSGDRWKVVVTCPPAATAALWLDVAVIDGAQVDFPLAPARVACGNRVVVPGAFTITGDRPNRVCVRISSGELAPARPPAIGPRDPDTACVTLRAE